MKKGVNAIAEGLYMLVLPMPFRLRFVNVFVLPEEGGFCLIDTGPNLPGVLPALESSLSELGLNLAGCRRILLTHFHMDHCGLAGIIAERSGASVELSAIEEETIRDLARTEEREARLRAFTRENGLDSGTLDRVIRAFALFRGAMAPLRATGTLAAGDRLSLGGRELQVVETPGHSRGHVSFHLPRESFLIAGDHVLPHITPNLSPDLMAPGFHPLESFLASLARVEGLAVEGVFPAHGRPFADLAGRIAQIRAHHRERSALALAALSQGPDSAFGVSRQIFGPIDSPFDRLLALNESYVHLLALEQGKQVRREDRDGLCLFSRTDS